MQMQNHACNSHFRVKHTQQNLSAKLEVICTIIQYYNSPATRTEVWWWREWRVQTGEAAPGGWWPRPRAQSAAGRPLTYLGTLQTTTTTTTTISKHTFLSPKNRFLDAMKQGHLTNVDTFFYPTGVRIKMDLCYNIDCTVDSYFSVPQQQTRVRWCHLRCRRRNNHGCTSRYRRRSTS